MKTVKSTQLHTLNSYTTLDAHSPTHLKHYLSVAFWMGCKEEKVKKVFWEVKNEKKLWNEDAVEMRRINKMM